MNILKGCSIHKQPVLRARDMHLQIFHYLLHSHTIGCSNDTVTVLQTCTGPTPNIIAHNFSQANPAKYHVRNTNSFQMYFLQKNR